MFMYFAAFEETWHFQPLIPSIPKWSGTLSQNLHYSLQDLQNRLTVCLRHLALKNERYF